MKILFISRAYPPVIGGIENQNYELSRWLSEIAETKIIANKYGKVSLPVFLPYCVWKALILARKYDVVLLGDGVLGIVGWFVKFFYKKPVVCVLHGLDLTYKFWLYKKLWVNFFIPKLDKFVAVGNETVKIAVEKGLDEEKVVFIPNGVDTNKFSKDYEKSELKKVLGEKIEGKKFILTSGRLAKRKGVAWFIKNVLPKLPEDVIYVVAGDGGDRKNIEMIAEKRNMSGRVRMLGRVSDEARNILLKTCDIFVQPNIKIPGTMEGFGISVIEAGASGITVLASELEGLKDAIQDGQNGFLVESGNAEKWIQKIEAIFAAGEDFRKQFGIRAAQFVKDNYSWDKIAGRYLEELEKVK